MKPPLKPVNEDFRWKLLSNILSVFDLRSSKQTLSKKGILPLQESIPVLKIVPLSMFFSSEISYVVKELEIRKSLRNFLKICSVPSEHEIYGFMSKFDPNSFTDFVIELLNNQCLKRKAGSKGIIIDSTDINLNLNWNAKNITKKSLESKEYKWGYSTHRGFFIGLKLTLAIEAETLKPLAFLINEANVPEAKIYFEILDELKRRRILKSGDIVYADRGYYSYENYAVSIKQFRIIPLLFPRKNCNFKKLFNLLNYPLKIFDSKRDTYKEIRIYKWIVAKFKSLITNWKDFKSVRSIIEDIFKLAKKAYSMEDLHRYTKGVLW